MRNVDVGFRGGIPVTIRDGEQRDLSLIVRLPISRQLHLLDDVGRPVTDVVIDGSIFWSAHNHCGFPSGVKPLFGNTRPNADGILTVPDGDFEYGCELRGGEHLSVVDPPADDWFPTFFTTYFDSPERIVRVHRHKAVTLEVHVSVGQRPARGVFVGALVPACGNGSYVLGPVDENGMLRVPDFYPDEVEAVCVGDQEGHLLFTTSPKGQASINIDLPADAPATEGFCFVR